ILVEAYKLQAFYRRYKIVLFVLNGQKVGVTMPELKIHLRDLSLNASANHTQYLYPTSMDNFYVAFGENKSNYILYEVFSLGRRNSPSFTFNQITLENMRETSFRTNMQQATLSVAIVDIQEKELQSKFNPETNTTVLISGLSQDIISFLQDSLNFTMKITNYHKAFWIDPITNVSYRKVDRVLNDETDDIFILKSSFYVKRAKSFTLMVPHNTQALYAFFRQPNIGSDLNLIWHSFTLEVWITLAIILALLAICKAFLVYVQSVVMKISKMSDTNISDCFLWAMALLTQRGWSDESNTISLRIVFLTTSVMGLICYVAFSANLISVLSIVTVPIKTFAALLDTDIRIAADVESSVARNTILGDEKDLEFGNARKLRQKHEKFCTMSEGGELILNGPFAFIAYNEFKVVLIKEYHQTGDDFCRKIASLPVQTLPFQSGMLGTKNFPYKEMFYQKIILLHESGLLYRFQKHFNSDSSNVNCRIAEQLNRNVRSLEYHDVSTAYFIFSAGVFTSIIIYSIERLMSRIKYLMAGENRRRAYLLCNYQ
ncbi:unnamed protein product, partial [Allacma fusca]